MAPTSRSTKQFFSTAARQWRDLVHRIIAALERKRKVQFVVAIALSIVCASVVAESITTARSQRKKWSSNVSVVVLTNNVTANERLTSDNTEIVALPTAIVATDALTALPARATTRVALTANTPLSQSLLFPTSESVDIPAGWRIIALPADASLPPLTVGDKVDLIAGETVIASGCIVYSTNPYAMAVPQDSAPTVATAARIGDISVVSYAWHS